MAVIWSSIWFLSSTTLCSPWAWPVPHDSQPIQGHHGCCQMEAAINPYGQTIDYRKHMKTAINFHVQTNNYSSTKTSSYWPLDNVFYRVVPGILRVDVDMQATFKLLKMHVCNWFELICLHMNFRNSMCKWVYIITFIKIMVMKIYLSTLVSQCCFGIYNPFQSPSVHA